MENIENRIKRIEILARTRDYETYGCPRCENGKIKVLTDGFPGYGYSICSCVEEAIEVNQVLENLYNDSGLLNSFLEKYPFSKYVFTDKLPKETMINFIDRKFKKDWLYLYGTVGTGKTYASYILAYFALAKGMTVYTEGFSIILNNARPGGEVFGEPQGTMYGKALQADLLVIDDFGNEGLSDWMAEKTFALLNYRNSKGLLTVFTGNFLPESLEICKAMPQIASRIHGNSIKVIMSSKKDFRVANIGELDL